MSEANVKVDRLVMRPGAGWKRVAGAVYDHESGIRMHTLGMCRLQNGVIVSDGDAEHYYLQHKMIRINGGNRKRGLMAWARSLAAS